jgi:hypothetical protein
MLLYTVTDKEIYDLLGSGRKQFTPTLLAELGRARGMFLSVEEDRFELIDKLSSLTYGYKQMNDLQSLSEHATRGEKTTSVRLTTHLSAEDIKSVAQAYREQSPPDEKIVTYSPSADKYSVNVTYTETDFSKTRLRQRQKRETKIEFDIADNEVVVRYGGNAKAQEIVNAIRTRLEIKTQTQIQVESVDLSLLSTSEQKTRFFTLLIGGLPKFSLENVLSVRVIAPPNTTVETDDDDGQVEADEEIRNLIKDVALTGTSVLLSTQYQGLAKQGFHITSIKWQSKRDSPPYDIVEFWAGFDEPELGQGFKYAVRGVFIRRSDAYVKTIRATEESEKKALLALLDETSIKVFRTLRSDLEATMADAEGVK